MGRGVSFKERPSSSFVILNKKHKHFLICCSIFCSIGRLYADSPLPNERQLQLNYLSKLFLAWPSSAASMVFSCMVFGAEYTGSIWYPKTRFCYTQICQQRAALILLFLLQSRKRENWECLKPEDLQQSLCFCLAELRTELSIFLT